MGSTSAQIVRCGKCRGMLQDTTSDETVTHDIKKATVFLTTPAAAARAIVRGWRIWTGWRDGDTEYITRVVCPRDRA